MSTAALRSAGFRGERPSQTMRTNSRKPARAYVRCVTLVPPELSGVCARLQKGQLLVHRPVLHVSRPVVLVIVLVKEG
jgi:hypothetical protein